MKRTLALFMISGLAGALMAQDVGMRQADVLPVWGDQGNGIYVNPILNVGGIKRSD